MKHLYKITGMTCNGCKADVEHRLRSIQGIQQLAVDLKKEEVMLEMSKHVPVAMLQNALPLKYTITETKITDRSKQARVEQKQPQRYALFPLFLIFIYITIASFLMNSTFFDIGDFMLDFMGLFYVVFSFFKLLDVNGFQASFRNYDPLAKQIPWYGWVYPFIETLLGLMFLMRFNIKIALIVTLFILGLTTIGIIKVRMEKKTIRCACLGTVLKLPMTKATLIENMIMIVMALLMLMA